MEGAGEVEMRGARFDHVAHAAPTIRELLPMYAEQLGGRLLYGGDNERVGYRGLMLGYEDGSKIELLEPLPGSTFLDSFFARSPAGGLHHVTFRVRDLARSVAGFRDAGYEVVGVFTEDPDYMEAFIHPRAANGTVVQLLQAPDGVPAAEPGRTFAQVLAA